jgi:hypothetical protein
MTKALAWTSLGSAILFAALAAAGLPMWTPPDGGAARFLIWFGAVPCLALSILLAAALLILSAFGSET